MDTGKDKLAKQYIEEAISTEEEKEVIDKALKNITYDNLYTIYKIMKRRLCMDDVKYFLMKVFIDTPVNEKDIADHVDNMLQKDDNYMDIYWDTIDQAINDDY